MIKLSLSYLAGLQCLFVFLATYLLVCSQYLVCGISCSRLTQGSCGPQAAAGE